MKLTNPFVALVIAALLIVGGIWAFENFESARDPSAESIAALDAVESRWLDSLRLADLTPRMALPQVISDMQTQRRELDPTNYGKCLQEAAVKLQGAMDAAIARMFAFMDTSMQGDDEAMVELTVGMYTETYNSLWEQYITARQACQR